MGMKKAIGILNLISGAALLAAGIIGLVQAYGEKAESWR